MKYFWIVIISNYSNPIYFYSSIKDLKNIFKYIFVILWWKWACCFVLFFFFKFGCIKHANRESKVTEIAENKTNRCFEVHSKSSKFIANVKIWLKLGLVRLISFSLLELPSFQSRKSTLNLKMKEKQPQGITSARRERKATSIHSFR